MRGMSSEENEMRWKAPSLLVLPGMQSQKDLTVQQAKSGHRRVTQYANIARLQSLLRQSEYLVYMKSGLD